MTHITDHFVEIQRRVHLALERAGRSSDDVKIVAVSKGQPAAAIESARGAGATDFGENYVQEALDKIAAIGSTGLVWHFVGRIQSNKTRLIAERFDWVHTVDREQIAARLSAQRPAGLPPLNVLIQLNLAGEPQKGGIGSGDLLPLAKTISELPNVALRGLMTIPPAGLTEAACREHFAAVA
ncbi:MAG: YggS family pyridoxal phosphate-dependent enzyme, partial [Gammaproteobacteria bacterium]|nr:YggS family pyridoxal phosphate-dependent enzyme [Gammaproteobacteria bacterium]